MEFLQNLAHGELKTRGVNKHIKLLNAIILHDKFTNTNTCTHTSTDNITNKSHRHDKKSNESIGAFK